MGETPPAVAKKIQIPEYKDILSRIGRRYKKIGKGMRIQEMETARLQLVHDVITSKLESIGRLQRLLRSLDPFYKELLSIEFDEAKIWKSVNCLLKAKKMTTDFYRKYRYRLMATETPREARKTAAEARGRMLSLVKRCSRQLLLLKNLVIFLQELPSIDTELPTIIVAGAPSVGKSTIVANASRAKVEIASYPFTTKQIHVGHTIIADTFKVQLIDTPGLLDRPLDERNPIELRAIAALRHLKGAILFLFDPTPEATIDIERQVRLAEQVRRLDPEKPFVATITKIDLVDEDGLRELELRLKSLLDTQHVYRVIGTDKRMVRDLIEKIAENHMAPPIRQGERRV